MVTRKRCALCQHDDRDEIEQSLENLSLSCDDVDKKYGWASGTSAKHQRNHMGEYENSSNPSCKLCVAPQRKDIEFALSTSELDVDDVVDGMGISKQQIQRHMKHHLQPLVQESAATMLAKKEINEVDVLANNITMLDRRMQQVFADDDLDPKMIDALTKLAREIRESLKYMMEFKGKLVHKRQDTIVVHQMQVIKEVLAQNHPDVWLDIRKQMEEKMQ